MINKPSNIITIGTFDGVHIGHQNILKHVASLADETNCESTVLTLFPHPRMVLHNDNAIKLLNSINEREALLKSYGIKNVVIKTFDTNFANLSAENYVKTILVDELNAKTVVIGYDHHFGKNRSANINDLQKFGEHYGFEVKEISAQDVKNVTVSSTKIRNALNSGDILTANGFLGYNYSITGEVIHGEGIGKTLGFPTANISIKEHYKLIPKDGVYIITSTFENTTYYGMMNIGVKPTLNGKTPSVEAHFFNYSGDLYNKIITIKFIKRLRSEQKFSNLDALKQQIQNDKTEALAYINENLSI